MSEKITNKDFEKIQNILYNYNLLDDYFIDQDVSSNVGEIFVQNPDANVSLNTNDKEMVFQMGKMVSAVDKIWKGYLSAYDKATYKRQFDQYPLRDFDEYMASLGAKRSVDEKDFEPTGKITDWLELVNKEKKLRVGVFDTKEKQQKIEDTKNQIDSDIQKTKQYGKEILKGLLSKHPENVQNYLKSKGITDEQTFLDFLKKNNIKNKDDIKTYLNKQGFKIPDDIYNQIDNNALSTSLELDNTTTTELEQKKKESDENIQSGDAGTIQPRMEEKQKNDKLLKERQEFIEGKVINADKQKAINTAMNPYEFKISKGFDGFHTQGPFCLEKRKYFIEIFRPSISHFDTEFREATHEPQRVKDEGNDLLKNMHTFVKSPLKVEEQLAVNSFPNLDNAGRVRVTPISKFGNINIPGETINEPAEVGKIWNTAFYILQNWNEKIVSIPGRQTEYYNMIESLYNEIIRHGIATPFNAASKTIKLVEYQIALNIVKDLTKDLVTENKKGSNFFFKVLTKLKEQSGITADLSRELLDRNIPQNIKIIWDN